MSSTDDKARGTANDAVGNVKQVVGHVTGNDSLKTEGTAQEAKGEVQKTLGHAKDAVANVAEKIADVVKGSGH